MSKLIFQNCRMIDVNNYKELPKINIAQMDIAASGFGDKYKTAKAFLTQAGDGNIEEGVVELWDVAQKSQKDVILYECWVYLADTAHIFHFGTDKDTGIAMMQWSFSDVETGDEDGLSADLQEAFDTKD